MCNFCLITAETCEAAPPPLSVPVLSGLLRQAHGAVSCVMPGLRKSDTTFPPRSLRVLQGYQKTFSAGYT